MVARRRRGQAQLLHQVHQAGRRRLLGSYYTAPLAFLEHQHQDQQLEEGAPVQENGSVGGHQYFTDIYTWQITSERKVWQRVELVVSAVPLM